MRVGSLLLKGAAEAPRGITIYGQEKDNATWALSRMNMILHGNEVADIRKGDTITSPQFTLKPSGKPKLWASRAHMDGVRAHRLILSGRALTAAVARGDGP